MKRTLMFALLAACGVAQAQITNPATVNGFAGNSAQDIIVNQINGEFLLRQEAVRECEMIRRVSTGPKYFPPAKEGHELPFAADQYKPSSGLHANKWDNLLWVPTPLGNEKAWSGGANTTDKMKADSAKVKQMAANNTSSSSSSSSASSWVNTDGSSVQKSTAETEVTVNGKTYRTYQQEIKRTPPQPVEPQSYLDGAYFCR